MSLGWLNNKSLSHIVTSSLPNYRTFELSIFSVTGRFKQSQSPLLLIGLFPSRIPLREPFASPAYPGLVPWLPLVRAQSPGGSSPQGSHTYWSSHKNPFASLCTVLSPYLQAPLQSLLLQKNIQLIPSQAFFSLPSLLCRVLLPTATHSSLYGGDINFSSFPHHLENIICFSVFKWLLDYIPRPIF